MNVIIWSWCGQVSGASEQNIDTYLGLMSGLEEDYPEVTFVYMTGHLDGTGLSGNLHQRNEQIRDYCIDNNKFLYDFADIESYDPEGNYYLDKNANDGCYYDSDGNGSLDTINWGNNNYFLKTEIDATESSIFTEMGTSQLLSVPYALYADNAGNAFSGDFPDLSDKPVTLEGYGISDAASKEYVDSMLILIGNVQKLLIAGYTINQLLEGGRTPGELLADSVPVYNLYEAGVTVSDLYAEGVLVGRMEQAGIPEDDLIAAGVAGYLSDIEGNSYKWVKIGTQVWMAENLKVTKYNDDAAIDFPGTDNTAWSDNSTGAYAWYNNDKSTYKDEYGALYNWYAVNTGKLCPDGWHEPAKAELITLVDYLGGSSIAGDKLKDNDMLSLFYLNATNESGFSALAAGGRFGSGSYSYMGEMSVFWSSEAGGATTGLGIYMMTGPNVYENSESRTIGYQVRCVKDE